MSYTVRYTDSSKLPLIVEDGTINSTTDISLVGRSVNGYGELIAQNFLSILENFSSDTPPPRPTIGQTWYNTDTNELNIFTTNNVWKPLDGIFVSETTPTGNDNGDFWFKPSTSTFSIYYNTQWIPLIDTDPQNRMIGKIRYDDKDVQRKTVECLVNNQIVFIVSSDADEWVPQSSGSNTERLPTGALLTTEYPVIKKGINLNTVQTYSIHNYRITELNSLFFDVGRGPVYLEDNVHDGIGAGLTLRSSGVPINGSIFSIRTFENNSKLWVGSSITSPGNNRFAVGSPNIGGEYNEDRYNIFLEPDGTVTAKRATGVWVATDSEALEMISNDKIITPSTGGILSNKAITDRISTLILAEEGVDNTTLMTPFLSKQHIDSRIATTNDAINVENNTTLMTPATVNQAFNEYITTNEFLESITNITNNTLPPQTKVYFEENLENRNLATTHITFALLPHTEPYRYLVNGSLDYTLQHLDDGNGVSISVTAQIVVNPDPTDPSQAFVLSAATGIEHIFTQGTDGTVTGTIQIPQKEIVFSGGLPSVYSISLEGKVGLNIGGDNIFTHNRSNLSAIGNFIG